MQSVEKMHTETILGVHFFMGDAHSAVARMTERGGLLVVPAAPALKDIQTHLEYRRALLEADLVIPDSAFMVLVWNRFVAWRIGRPRLRRLSGLEYLRELLREPQVRKAGETFWIMAGAQSSALNLAWLAKQGIQIPASHVYHAPLYRVEEGAELVDARLLDTLNRLRPAHVVVTLGGGTQERLGLFLRKKLAYTPCIHCIGAAIAFLSGDQAAIPEWADRMYLGWLLRVLDAPQRYAPRYWGARKLLGLLLRYGASLPPAMLPIGGPCNEKRDGSLTRRL